MGPHFRTGSRDGVVTHDRGRFLPDHIAYLKVTLRL